MFLLLFCCFFLKLLLMPLPAFQGDFYVSFRLAQSHLVAVLRETDFENVVGNDDFCADGVQTPIVARIISNFNPSLVFIVAFALEVNTGVEFHDFGVLYVVKGGELFCVPDVLFRNLPFTFNNFTNVLFVSFLTIVFGGNGFLFFFKMVENYVSTSGYHDDNQCDKRFSAHCCSSSCICISENTE